MKKTSPRILNYLALTGLILFTFWVFGLMIYRWGNSDSLNLYHPFFCSISLAFTFVLTQKLLKESSLTITEGGVIRVSSLLSMERNISKRDVKSYSERSYVFDRFDFKELSLYTSNEKVVITSQLTKNYEELRSSLIDGLQLSETKGKINKLKSRAIIGGFLLLFGFFFCVISYMKLENEGRKIFYDELTTMSLQVCEFKEVRTKSGDTVGFEFVDFNNQDLKFEFDETGYSIIKSSGVLSDIKIFKRFKGGVLKTDFDVKIRKTKEPDLYQSTFTPNSLCVYELSDSTSTYLSLNKYNERLVTTSSRFMIQLFLLGSVTAIFLGLFFMSRYLLNFR